MISDIFNALLQAFLPLAVLSFAMVWWALHRGFLSDHENLKGLRKNIGELRKQKDRDKTQSNPLHEKWFKLGGGFYGTVGLYTYARIEWSEIMDLLGGLRDLVFKLEFQILVDFFIESLKNFIAAITWPLFWMNRIEGNFWIWLLLAYAGYLAGTALASRYAGLSVKELVGKQDEMSGED